MRPAPCVLLLLAAAASCAHPPPPANGLGHGAKPAAAPTSEQAAADAAEAWLRSLDAGDLSQCWTESSAKLRSAVSRPDFEKALRTSRPLGNVASRTKTSAVFSTSLPGTAAGAYVTVTFETTFPNTERAIETLVMSKEANTHWRVLGAHIDPMPAVPAPQTSSLPAPPARLGLDAFYRKYLDAGGIPIVSSARARDQALFAAREVLDHVLRKDTDVRRNVVRARLRLVVIAADEKVLDVPEYADQLGLPATVDVDSERGTDASPARPIVVAAEENLRCLFWGDPHYHTATTLIHSLGHVVARFGLGDDAAFQRDLRSAYEAAMAKGLWRGTYSAVRVNEYWAVGTEAWFGPNLHAVADDPREIATRARLAIYDPTLHALLARAFADDGWRYDCLGSPAATTADTAAAEPVTAPAVGPTAPSCPSGMASVAGGTYVMDGSVTVQPFCMDATEVTVGQYAACARARRCTTVATTIAISMPGLTDEVRARLSASCNGERRDRSNHPVNCVDWNQADAYCRATGKRLPTKEEWVWAARGGEARAFPWGDEPPQAQLCWSGMQKQDGTCSVGSARRGDAPGGIHDLAGNVWEWTASGTLAERIMMGGGWNAAEAVRVRVAARWGDQAEPTTRIHNTGFRCVR